MKFLIVSVMLFGLIVADVSHLQHQGHSHYGGSLKSNNYFSHTGHSAQPAAASHMYPRILRNDYTNDGHGTYNFAYETENGISHNEDGATDNSKRGQYSYTGDDGKVYTVMYWADESGFHAVGDHLPGSQNNQNLGGGNGNSYNNYNKKPATVAKSASNSYQYPKPTTKSGYNYPTPKTAYLPPPPQQPKTQYLPPAPSTDYLPPNFY